MAILLNDNLKIAAAKPVDNRYGPYVDTATALSQIPVFQRYTGLTVGIRDSGDVVEYWFKDGVTDLVPKTSVASGGDWYVVSTSSSVADNSYIIADSSSTGFTLTLPASPASGSYVWIQDAKGSWETNNVIVDPNGNQIVGLSDSLSLNVSNSIVLLTYVGGNVGWDVKNVAGDFSDEFTILTPLTTAAISVGSSAQCASLTIDQYGRVVSASNNSITPQGIGAFSTADIISITNGGTGSTTAAAALTALGAQPALTSASPLGISQGGTGTITTEDARAAMGGFQSIDHNITTQITGTMNTAVSPHTLTYSSNIVLTIDSIAPSVGDTAFVSGQGTANTPNQTANGPWIITQVGTASQPTILTRPSWFSGTVKNNFPCAIRYGNLNAGIIRIAIGPLTTGNKADIVVGTSLITGIAATGRQNVATISGNTFIGRQTFFGNTSQTNPCSFQTATALLSTRQAHAIEWDNNLMYITPQALATTQLNRSVNAAYIPALTSADILTLGSPMATLQIGALTSASAGVLGQTVLDTVNEVLFICIGTNKWRKVQLSNF